MPPLVNSPRPPSPSGAYRQRGIRLRRRAQERCSRRRARGHQLATSPTTLTPAAPPPPSSRPITAERYGGVVAPRVGLLGRGRRRGGAHGPYVEQENTR